MFNKIDGWTRLFGIQMKAYFSNIISLIVIIFVPIIVTFGFAATIGTVTGFVAIISMILIIVQTTGFSATYYSIKKTTLNNNLTLTNTKKLSEYMSIFLLMFVTGFLAFIISLFCFWIITWLLPVLGWDFISFSPSIVPNPFINSNQIVDANWDSSIVIRAPDSGTYFFDQYPNYELVVTDSFYITNWKYIEYGNLLWYFFVSTLITFSMSIFITSISDQQKTYFFFVLAYFISYIIFGGMLTPTFTYTNPEGQMIAAGNMFGTPVSPPEQFTWTNNSFIFWIEHINPLYYINQWAFTILGTASTYDFTITINQIDSNGEFVDVVLAPTEIHQSVMSFYRHEVEIGDTGIFSYDLMSPTLNIANSIPETNRFLWSTDIGYDLAIYMPIIMSLIYLLASSMIDNFRKKHS